MAPASFKESHPLDIGRIFKQSTPISDEQRYRLYTSVWQPGRRYVFPRHNENGKSCAFQHDWLCKYSWLVYSEEVAGGFCLPCVLFAKHSSDFGQLVSRPLTAFTTASNRLREHDKKAYHKNALIDAEAFLSVYNQKQATVEQQIMSAHQQQIQKNRNILASLVETIAFCGRQNIALRGHRNEDRSHVYSEEESGNPGNFLALVKFRMQCGDEVLKKHISTSRGNAMYVSPPIQNQLISCIGDWILESVLKEVR